MRRRVTIAAVTTVLAMALAGCGSAPGGGGAPAAPLSTEGDYNAQPYDNIRDGGTYTSALVEINPQFNTFQGDATLYTRQLWNWYNPRVITFTAKGDPLFDPDYLVGAKEATVDGNTQITYTINPQAVYNDGTPIDWRSFDTTWKANNGTDKAYIALSTDGYDRITSVTRGADDRQVLVTFRGVNLYWPGLFNELLHPAVNTPALYNQGYLNNPHAEWGAGPYTIASIDQQAGTVIFERNPRWWGKRGKLDKRVFVVYESQASINAFRNGQIDSTGAGTAERLAQVKDLPGVVIRRSITTSNSLLTLNSRSPLLSDPAVRKAVMQGVDRRQIGQILHQGLDYTEQPPGSLTLFPFQDGYQDNFAKVVTFDPDAARRGLDAAGWPAGPDGTRSKDGRALTLEYVRVGDDPRAGAAATALAAMLKNVGVTMTIRQVPSADFAKITSQKNFDIFFSGYSSSDPYGFAYFCQLYCSDSQLNLSGTGTPDLDEKIRSVLSLPTLQEQYRAGNDVETEAFGRFGVMPMENGPTIVAVKAGLANVGAGIFFTPLPEEVGYQK